MKTIEKMREAVLAYCETLCPNDEDTFEVTICGLDCTITGRHHHGISGFDIRETGFFKRRIYQIRSSDDGNWWHLYYIFLGLSERDAVAEKQKTNDYLVERIDKAEWKVAELKASLNTAQQMYTDLLVGTTDAIAAKDAEIKRLREGIQKAIDNFFPAIGSHKECIQDLKALLSPELLTNGDCPNCYDGCEWCKSVTAECSLLSPAPVTEDEFSIGAYAPECSPTFEQLTENDNLTMMQRLEKRMLPFHKIDSPKNEDHHE